MEFNFIQLYKLLIVTSKKYLMNIFSVGNRYHVSGMSVTLHKHGDSVRLGIIGDAMIGPHHFTMTKEFPRSVKALADRVGVRRTASRSRSPSPITPVSPTSLSPGY